ncbi:MAG: TrmH family RNA methyltransferase [Cyanobacteria bacterium P01_H01_bin.121]
MIYCAFILVEPEDDRNIGAAARALNTMGYSDLRLVRPKGDHCSDRAQALAHGSQHILESATVYPELTAACQDLDFTCATTVRHRLTKQHYVSVRELPGLLARKGESTQRVGLVFGCETAGLSSADLDTCDLITTIPQSQPQPSLNLAQAIMVYSFVLSADQTTIQIDDQRVAADGITETEYTRLKDLTLQLMDRIGLTERYKGYVVKALARLDWTDLYLIHDIRRRIDRKLDSLEDA